MSETILIDGKEIVFHKFGKRKDACQLCGETEKRLHDHHYSYEKNLCVTLCKNHHNMVHREKDHPLHPIDKRLEINIPLNKENTKLFRENFAGYTKREALNIIVKERLQKGHFQLNSSKNKKFKDIVSWYEFKKIGGSFIMENPELLHEFLIFIMFNFNNRMDRRAITYQVLKFLRDVRDGNED